MLFLSLLGLAAAAPVLQGRQAPSGVPSYVVDYAPVVYLFSEEKYFPSDIGAQLTNTNPQINYTAVSGAPSPLTLDNLNALNDVANASGGSNVYLTSNSDPTTEPMPQYLYGVVPDNSTGATTGAISCAIIVHDHNNGTLDAYYMYFYAFNYGGTYYGLTVDDHIGDWEHNMVRFNSTIGQPTQVYYSQHSGGEAFTYAATEKYPDNGSGVRPVAYSGNGTHANYATSGNHDHTIPGVNLPAGPIEDHTDQGYLWDPTLSAYYYSFTPSSATSDSGTFAAYDDSTPVNWLYFTGHWGDEEYPESDPRQSCAFTIKALCEWQGGPTGPEDKDLNRVNVCPDSTSDCHVNSILLPKRR